MITAEAALKQSQLKSYDEIEDIIVNRLGLTDIGKYRAFLDQFNLGKGGRYVTQEDIDLLSPDHVNNTDFWCVVEKLFGTDCVANAHSMGSEPFSRMAGNRNNLFLARDMGTLSIIDVWRHYNVQMLEIGPGYGNVKNYVEANTCFEYTGVDVFPRVEGVISCDIFGYLPSSVLEQKFDLVYSSNVWQHFSSKQRERYLEDIAKILKPHGRFSFNLLLMRQSESNILADANGKNYLTHYGQMTEIPNYNEFVSLIYKKGFFVDVESFRPGSCSLTSFSCGLKPIESNK